MMKKPMTFPLLVLMLVAFTTFLPHLQAQEEEYGLASYYSDEFQGRSTAYGDVYDKNKLTAAHKLHPYGSILRVTRLDNKKSVDVKVIDKGPFIKGRVIDLSRRAAETLGIIKLGEVEVKVEVVSIPGRDTGPLVRNDSRTRTTEERPTGYEQTQPPPREEPLEEVVVTTPERESAPSTTTTRATAQEKPATTVATRESKATPSIPVSTPPKLVGDDYAAYGLYKIVLQKPASKGWGVQVASLTDYQNVLRQVANLQAKGFDNVLLSVERGRGTVPVYKIILGPFDTESSSQAYEKSLESRYKIPGFTVNLTDIKY